MWFFVAEMVFGVWTDVSSQIRKKVRSVAADFVSRNKNIKFRRETENPVRHQSKHSASPTYLFLTRRWWRRSIRDRSVINTRNTNQSTTNLNAWSRIVTNRRIAQLMKKKPMARVEPSRRTLPAIPRATCVSVHGCRFHWLPVKGGAPEIAELGCGGLMT